VARCAFFAVGRRNDCRRAGVWAARFAPGFFRLAFSASIRLTTLLGRSSGSTALIGLPAAFRSHIGPC